MTRHMVLMSILTVRTNLRTLRMRCAYKGLPAGKPAYSSNTLACMECHSNSEMDLRRCIQLDVVRPI